MKNHIHPHSNRKANFLLLFLLIPSLGFAQPKGNAGDYESLPGYLEIGNYLNPDTVETTTEVNLRPNILRLVAAAARKKKPLFARAVRDVRFIQVRVFETNAFNQEELKSGFAALSEFIDGKGWDRIVKVNEPEKTVRIYVLPGPKDTIDGLAVLVLEPDESVIVNIVGNIDLESISEIGAGLHLEALEKVETTANPES